MRDAWQQNNRRVAKASSVSAWRGSMKMKSIAVVRKRWYWRAWRVISKYHGIANQQAKWRHGKISGSVAWRGEWQRRWQSENLSKAAWQSAQQKQKAWRKSGGVMAAAKSSNIGGGVISAAASRNGGVMATEAAMAKSWKRKWRRQRRINGASVAKEMAWRLSAEEMASSASA
jgi:hypothetical protein